MIRFLTLLTLITLTIFPKTQAQQPLPIIPSTTDETYIIEADDPDKRAWYLVPEARPDIYYTDLSKQSRTVTLYTDQDSFRVTLAPGEQVDMIVLLNGKDSCYQRFINQAAITRYAEQVPSTHDTIPFSLTPFNNLKVTAIINRRDTLFLKFDSGAGGLVLTTEAIKKRPYLIPGQEGVEKPNFRRIRSYNSLQLGNLKWDSLRIRPALLSGQGTEGRFGWDIFEGRVVEIDYDREVFIVHSSLEEIPAGYTRFDMEFRHGLFRIGGDLTMGDVTRHCQFLFDNGYQRAIFMDGSLMEEEGFPMDLPVIKRNYLRDSQGDTIHTRIVNSAQLAFGDLELTDIPTQVINEANPANFPTHILGGELLKRFNMILDFHNHYIWLQPNGLVREGYVDAE